jgi:hypothetical protein
MSDLVSATITNASDVTFERSGYNGDWPGEEPSAILAPGQATRFSGRGVLSAQAWASYRARGSDVVLSFRIGQSLLSNGSATALCQPNQDDVFNVYTKSYRGSAEFVIKNWPE